MLDEWDNECAHRCFNQPTFPNRSAIEKVGKEN